jgi:hypothetical protein
VRLELLFGRFDFTDMEARLLDRDRAECEYSWSWFSASMVRVGIPSRERSASLEAADSTIAGILRVSADGVRGLQDWANAIAQTAT